VDLFTGGTRSKELYKDAVLTDLVAQCSRVRLTTAEVMEVFKQAISKPQLLEARDCAGRSALMKAAQLGQPQLCAALLSAKADPNSRGTNGWTALHHAAIGTCADTCRLLIERRAEVQAATSDGRTALFYAYRAGENEDIMRLLHSFGARPDPRSQNTSGEADWSYVRYRR